MGSARTARSPPSSTKLHYQRGSAACAQMVAGMPVLTRESYVPRAWWGLNPHLATILASKARRPLVASPPRPLKVEIVPLSDGGLVSLAWYGPQENGRPVVLLLPGINNDHRTPFLRHAVDALCALESMLEPVSVTPVVLNWRGTAGLPLATPRPYCSLCSCDVEHVLKLIASRLPKSPLVACGWSMGGNALVNCLGRWPQLGNSKVAKAPTAPATPVAAGDTCPLRAAMVVSGVFDLEAASAHLRATLVGNVYVRAVSIPMAAYMWRHRAVFRRGGVPMGRILQAFASGDYEGTVLAPLWGLPDKEAYWVAASSAKVVGRVATPLLVLHAADDPMVALHSLPLAALATSACAVVAVTPSGGHVGYTASDADPVVCFSDRVLQEFICQALGAKPPQRPRSSPAAIAKAVNPRRRLFLLFVGFWALMGVAAVAVALVVHWREEMHPEPEMIMKGAKNNRAATRFK